MSLREVVVGRLADELGPEAEVVRWLVEHHERCVGEVVLDDGRRAAVKADVDARRLDREAEVLRAGCGGGVPLPRVLATWDASPAMLLLEWLDGDWLSPERSARAWAAVGAALRRLHDLDVPGLSFYGGNGSWHAGMATWFARARETGVSIGAKRTTVDAVGVALDGVLAEPGPPSRTLHGDCMPVHWRLDDDDRVVGALDLGDTMRGDPVFDLAVLTLRDLRRLPTVLNGYAADQHLRAWARRALPVYRSFRHLGEAVWLAEHGYNPRAALAQAERTAAALP